MEASGKGSCWTNNLFRGTRTGKPVSDGPMYPSLMGLSGVSGPFMYNAARLYAYDAWSTLQHRTRWNLNKASKRRDNFLRTAAENGQPHRANARATKFQGCRSRIYILRGDGEQILTTYPGTTDFSVTLVTRQWATSLCVSKMRQRA